MSSTSDRCSGRIRPARLAILASALLLADCGGGGGGGGYNGGGNMGPPLAPTVSISADPMTITLGQSVTLSWTVSNAASCAASGGWSGNIAVDATTQTVTPTASGSVSYTLTCTAPTGSGYGGGGGGQTAKTATVTVNPASAYSFTNLVSNTGTGALKGDSHLVNPWGIAFGPTSPVWVSNNHDNTSTLYDGAGNPFPVGTPLVVTTPDLDPTGIVFNGSKTDFMVNAAPASFIFTGESGKIAAWASGAAAVIVYPAAGADAGVVVYKGLALVQNATNSMLYATDFHNNKVDAFDKTFAKVALPATAFVDPNLPAGYAPFGIQALTVAGTPEIFVSYAKQDDPANAMDDTAGAGLGLIDIFDINGVFIKRLVTVGGALNAPWGMALAPANFGTMSNMLLVGNFGDGKINGYDPATGTYMGAISDDKGAPFVSSGLWGIAFGNGSDNFKQPSNTLFFTAGPNEEADGIYGRIDLGPAPVLN